MAAATRKATTSTPAPADNLTTYSNYGVHTVDVAAPGQSIISTWTNGGYVTTSGTSMATPMVTGTLALVRAVHPDWSYAQIINQVTSTVDKVSALASKIASGGRVNAARAVGASAADTTGPRVVAATANASGSKPVSAVRVTFSEAVNPSTFTVNDIVSLTGPRGTLRVTGVRAVAGSGDTAFDITFDTQTAPGVYKLVLGSDIRDRAGNRMDQNRNGIRGESVADRFTASFTIDRLYTYTGRGPADINDNSRAGLTLTVDRDITISDLNVQVHLTHTNDSNLYIHLRGPDGTDVVLANRRGGNGNNYWITVFDDEAATPVSAGQAPFTGSFRPDGSLSAFDGKNARGTWTLWVEDRAAGDQGVLHYFSLMIEERVSGNGAAVTAMEETDATPSVQAASDAPSQTAASEQATSTVGNTMTSEDVVSDYFNLPGRESAPAEGGHSASSVWMSSRIVGAADTVSEMHLKRTAVDLVFTAGRGKRDARSPLLEASALSSDDLFASFEADELTTLTNTPS